MAIRNPTPTATSMPNSGIYRISSVVDGRFYIGSAVNLRNRINDHRNHLRKNRHDNARMQNAWNKHGEENFKFETLIVCDKANLIFYEQRTIDVLKAADRNVGFNICPIAGSQLGFLHSEDTKARIRAACKGWKHTEEARKKISDAQIGRRMSPESVEKMAATKRGIPLSEGHRLKISKAQIGKKKGPMSEQGKANCRAGRKGIRLSEEHKQNIGASLKGRKVPPEIIAKRWVTRRAKMEATKNVQLTLALDFE